MISFQNDVVSAALLRRQNFCLCLLTLLIGILLTIFSERIPIDQGLGYDGMEYGQWAMHFDQVVRGEIPVTPYRVVRILPSAVAWSVMTILGVNKIPENVIRFFQIYNLMLLSLGAFAWGCVADAIKLRQQGKVLGYLGLFCNYLVLKYNFYYPVLTDVTGYVGILCIIWAYLKNRPILLFLSTLAGSFSWPTICIYGGLLLVFPRQNKPLGVTRSSIARAPVLIVALLYLYFSLRPGVVTPPYHPLSVAIVCLYLGGAAWFLFSDSWYLSLKHLFGSCSIIRLGLGLAGAVVYIAGKGLAADQPPDSFFGLSTLDMFAVYVRGICVPLSTRLPGEFLVAHVLYFGPMLLLTACLTRQAAAEAGRFGFGYLLCVAAACLHGIMPLSRQVLAGYPFIVIVTVLTLERYELNKAFVVCFTFVSLFVSKVWLLVNSEADPKTAGTIHDKAFAWAPGFSFDRFISSTGRWMSADWYAVQAAFLLGLFILYYWYFHAPTASKSSQYSEVCR